MLGIGLRGLTRLVVLLALFWYYRGQVVLNTIVTRSPFPRGYIQNGNYTADCTTVRDWAVPAPESMSNCEDETFWDLRDAAGRTVQRPVLVTCDAGRRAWNTVMGPLRDPNPRGSLWIYYAAPAPSGGPTATTPKNTPAAKFLAPSLAPNTPHRIALIDFPAGHTFHPLGIAVWPSTAGNASHLYVVNHAARATVVEQFLLDPARPTEARHVRTIASRWFVSPNALALTSPDAFYVSNDHLLTRRLWLVGHVLPLMETILGWPLGFVAHVTLTPPGSLTAIASHVVAKYFVPFANGLALSPSGAHLAIVSTSLAQVSLYARSAASPRLTQRLATVSVPFSPDNAHFTHNRKTGLDEVIVAGHPHFPALVQFAGAKYQRKAAPSWVARIVPKTAPGSRPESVFDVDAPVSTSSKLAQDGTSWTLETLFQSDGNEEEGGFASSSTGLSDPDTGNVYITGLYASGGMLVCKPGSNGV